MQDQPARRGAALPGGAERPPQHAVERKIQIGIIHHDHRVLPTHFERETLVHLAAGRANGRARLRRSRKRDHRDVGVFDERAADDRALPVHQLHHLGRQSRFEQHLDQQMRRVRHIFGGLEDHGVSAQQRRKHFPGGNREREVERRDQPRDPDRPAIAHRPLVAQLRRHDSAEQAPALGGGVECRVDPLLHVAARLRDDLPHLARHRARDVVLALD